MPRRVVSLAVVALLLVASLPALAGQRGTGPPQASAGQASSPLAALELLWGRILAAVGIGAGAPAGPNDSPAACARGTIDPNGCPSTAPVKAGRGTVDPNG